MTEERKHKQMPWNPTIERMPLLYNVETGPNLYDDNPVLLLDAEAEENESDIGNRIIDETVRSNATVAPIRICADEVWAGGGTALSSLLC